MDENLKNILIIKPSSLGDIVLALPALSALRRSFPDAKIAWLVRPAFAPIIEGHPHLDEIILFDRRFLGKAWYNPRAFAALIKLISGLRHRKFDAVLDLQGLFRTAAFSWLSGCKKRFGMTNAREFASFFYTHKIPQTKDCIHVVDYNLKIAQAAGASDSSVEFVFPKDNSATQSVKKLLADRNIGADKYAVFIIGSAHEDKCWPLERFAVLAEKVSSQFGFKIIATGTASEKASIEKLQSITNIPIVEMVDKTNLHELTALLKGAQLVVTNDTGPGHIAAGLAVPLVLIVGKTNPARIEPYHRPQCVAAIEPYSRGAAINSTDPKHDIKAVTIDNVYEKIRQQLEQKQSPTPIVDKP